MFCFVRVPLLSQDPGIWISSLLQAKDYVPKRASSYDRSGGNADLRTIAAGETLTLLDEAGPGMISHVWFTIASDDPHHLKALVGAADPQIYSVGGPGNSGKWVSGCRVLVRQRGPSENFVLVVTM